MFSQKKEISKSTKERSEILELSLDEAQGVRPLDYALRDSGFGQ